MMHFSICSLTEIKHHANAHTKALLSRRKNAMNMVVECLLDAAAADARCTRTIAIVARQIKHILAAADAPLAREFQQRLIDEALATFFYFWAEFPGKSKTTREYHSESSAPDAVDPRAVGAFVGDLYSAGLLSFDAFACCAELLLHRPASRTLLRCLFELFAHGGARAMPGLTPAYLLDCIGTVRRWCTRDLGICTREEQALKELLYTLVYRAPGAFWPDVIDARLDLDHALTSSVCLPTKRQLEPPTRTSSASSTESDSEAGHLKLHMPQPMRPILISNFSY